MVMSIPGGVRAPASFVDRNFHERIYNFKLRPDDIWIVTFPKCGTTWTQNILWRIVHDFDYEAAKTMDQFEMVPFLDFSHGKAPHR